MLSCPIHNCIQLISDSKQVYENAREKAHRFGIFSENLREIRRHNLSGASWKKGVNQFSDLTTEEFRATLNYKPSAQNAAPVKKVKGGYR